MSSRAARSPRRPKVQTTKFKNNDLGQETPQEAGQFARASQSVPWIVGVVLFLLYVATLSTGMHFGNGVELATAAYVLGVPHPTGYPLYMILLKLFMTILPLGEVIVRTNLFNAVVCAAGGGLATLLMRDTLDVWENQLSKKARLISAAAFGLCTGVMRFYWDNAVITEVYALQFLLTILFMIAGTRSLRSPDRRWMYLAAAAVGLGLAHHRMSVFMIIPFALLWWVRFKRAPEGTRRSNVAREAAVSALIICAGLALYLYLPIRAAAHPPINWGNPRTPTAFISHVRGAEYLNYRFLHAAPDKWFTGESYVSFASHLLIQVAGDFARQFYPFADHFVSARNLERVFNWPGTVGGLIAVLLFVLPVFGAMHLWRRARWPLVIGGLIALQNLALVFLYNIVDISDYCVFPFWFFVFCGAIGLVEAARRTAPLLRNPPTSEAAYAALLVPFAITGFNYRVCDQSRNFAAEDYSAFVLPNSRDMMPTDTLLLTGGDQDIFTCWYRQVVRRERPDVLVFGSNFIYRDFYPEFFTPAQRAQYDLHFGNHIPRDPREFIAQLADGVIDRNIGRYPIYTSTMDPFALQALNERYAVKPVRQMLMAGETTTTIFKIEPRSRAAEKKPDK